MAENITTNEPSSTMKENNPENADCLVNNPSSSSDVASSNGGAGDASNAASPSDLSTKSRGEADDKGPEPKPKSPDVDDKGHGSVVAAHYNTLEDKGLEARFKSRIFYLRNFNNWIKSMLINEYLSKIWQKNQRGAPLRVLDMCCGKGGDLLKWRRGNITHLICADIASTSVEQCENRYKELQNRNRSDLGFGPVFTAEFISADCTKVRLRERYKDPSIELDVVNCQFAFHYCFESLPQAECMIRNAAECLRIGGFFIGTIPDAYEVMHRLQKSGKTSFGNEIYNVDFEGRLPPYPLFGTKYNFHLEGVVDCPEFLVHFPTFVKLAEKHGLQLVAKERFGEFYSRHKPEGKSLLQKMQALETYPPFHDAPLLGNPHDYEHAQQYMQKSTGHRKVGTLSKTEWEAASLYLVFAFEKVKKI